MLFWFIDSWSREVDWLTVAEVENDVLGSEIDAQADDAAPPK